MLNALKSPKSMKVNTGRVVTKHNSTPIEEHSSIHYFSSIMRTLWIETFIWVSLGLKTNLLEQ